VSHFSKNEIAPKVREMDETQKLDKQVLKGLFDQGVSAFFHA